MFPERVEAHLALGPCRLLRPEPIRQRGLDGVLQLERVYPAQPGRILQCRDSCAHAGPPGDGGRSDVFGDSVGECLRGDGESYVVAEWGHAIGTAERASEGAGLTDSAFAVKQGVVYG
jgi:hypothetical protein